MTRPASPRAARACPEPVPESPSAALIRQAIADYQARREAEPEPVRDPPQVYFWEAGVNDVELNRALHGWTGTLPPEPWAFHSLERELSRREKERHAE
jgi:hypothetical protein